MRKREAPVSVKKEPEIVVLSDSDDDRHEAASPPVVGRASTSSRTPFPVKKEERKSVVQDRKPFLPEESIARRLLPIRSVAPRVNVRKHAVNQTFLRKFISQRYGGNLQSAYPRPNKDHLKNHTISVFAFLRRDWNPYLPENPGEHGIAFTKDRPATDDVLPLFVWNPPNQWQYYGHYVVHDSEPLSEAEWLNQDAVVQEIWIRNFFRNDWFGKMNAAETRRRVAKYVLRKERAEWDNKHDPTEEEIQECLDSGRYSTVNHETLRDDLDAGRAKLPVRALECVRYDYEFLSELLKGYCDDDANWKVFPAELKEHYARLQAREASVVSQEDASSNESDELDRRPRRRRKLRRRSTS